MCSKNCTGDQRLCFPYTNSTIPSLVKSEITSFWSFSMTVQAGLCRTWQKTPKTGFLASRLMYKQGVHQTSKVGGTVFCCCRFLISNISIFYKTFEMNQKILSVNQIMTKPDHLSPITTKPDCRWVSNQVLQEPVNAYRLENLNLQSCM